MNLSLHPLFVGWFFVLTLFASNIDVLTLPELSLPLLAATAVSFSLTALLYLVIRNIRKASIASTIILMMMFSYGYLYDFLLSVSWLSIVAHHKILAPLLTILTGLLLWKTIKSKSDMKNATQILNVTGIALLCMPLITCSPMLLKRAEKASRYDMGDNQIETLAVSGSVPERDIIFIILDKYGSNATLQRVYGYDNSWFTDSLERKGFFVADRSNCNYPATFLSLSSTLNMAYHEGLPEESKDQTPVYKKAASRDLVGTPNI